MDQTINVNDKKVRDKKLLRYAIQVTGLCPKVDCEKILDTTQESMRHTQQTTVWGVNNQLCLHLVCALRIRILSCQCWTPKWEEQQLHI